MSDDSIDFASEIEECERQRAALFRKPVAVRTGKCASCGEPLLRPLALVCDAECKEDYGRQQRAAGRNGRPPADHNATSV